MNDINHVILIGRLTNSLGSDERNFGYLPNGQARASISIAVNRRKKQGDEWIEEVSFFDVSIYGKMAENLKPYLFKGKQIAVDGHLKQDRWADKDGNSRSRISIIADNIQLLGASDKNGSKDANNQTETQKGEYKPKSYTPPMYQDDYPGNSDGADDFPEDIPF